MKNSVKYLKILFNFIFMAFIIVLCIFVLPKLLAFFWPFVLALVIAAIANPLVRFLENKLKIRRKAGSFVVIVLTLAAVVAVCYGIIYLLVTEVVGFITSAPDMWSGVSKVTREFFDSLSARFARMPVNVQDYLTGLGDGVYESLSEWGADVGERAAATAGRGVKNAPLILVGTIMCILASYLFVEEHDKVSGFFKKIMPDYLMKRVRIVYDTMKSAVGGYFLAQFKIMGFVYVVLLAGLIILGVKYSVLIALLIALLDFLPLFGTGTIMWPWALYAFLQRDYKLAVGMMIVWGLSQLVRQLIQPKFVGDSIGMSPIPTLILLYVGFRLGGATGLIIAVPLGMIVYNLYKAGLFSNFLYSTRILLRDFRKMRIFTDEELKEVGIEATVTGAAASDTDCFITDKSE